MLMKEKFMLELVVRTREGQVVHLETEAGLSVMEIIRNAGIDEMLALCGGGCSCATCHVRVDEEFASQLPKMSEDESELLNGSGHRIATSRLSCQLVLNDAISGLRVTIAPED
jgi:2Fe-2S ferredoxin